MAQLLARRTIGREEESSNQACDSDKCHRVAKGRGPLLANSTSSTEMRHPPALSLPTLTLVGMGEIPTMLSIKTRYNATASTLIPSSEKGLLFMTSCHKRNEEKIEKVQKKVLK